jgi:heterodisulfide reductase subunit A
MSRIGVFVCWCGRNIAGTVDVAAVVDALGRHPGVVHAEDYTYMCSDPGQKKLIEVIGERDLDGVVVVACSPQLHDRTFKTAVAKAGLNPYLMEMANVREHCSWVHPEGEPTTRKAIEIARILTEKVKRNQPLVPIRIPVTRRALVLGGGIAGIQASLDIARAGYEVVLVERSSTLGGRASHLSRTFPHLEGASDLIRPKVDEVLSNERIQVLPASELEDLSGYVGNFQAKIRRDGNTIEETVGAVVAATGFDLYPLEKVPEYGGGKIPGVVSSLEFEEILDSADGDLPKEVVFVQCVRSRDPEKGVPYCSKICCLYTAKQAILYQQKMPGGQSYVFYTDVRVAGKAYEDFLRRAPEEFGVMYLRGRVSRIFEKGQKVVVWGADTLSGRNVEIEADMVVLATAMTPRVDSPEVAKKLGIAYDQHGFFSEAHPKLRPVETNTAGVFLAGACQAPRDIADTVAQASGAASKVLGLFSSDELEREPEVARIKEDQCSGCLDCAAVCAYRAIEAAEVRGRRVARINEGLCQGCGLCVATCRSRSIDLDGYTDEELFAEIGVI